MIIKPTRQKQLPGSVLWKKCSQKFRKIGREKPVSDTVVFLSILQSFQKHLFYWTPPVAASSKFKGSGFTEAVMQMNFWITHDLVISTLLVLVGIIVFIFGKHKFSVFQLHLDGFFNIWYSILFLKKKDRNKAILGSVKFLLRKTLS